LQYSVVFQHWEFAMNYIAAAVLMACAVSAHAAPLEPLPTNGALIVVPAFGSKARQ
jgi:hypothetical protein